MGVILATLGAFVSLLCIQPHLSWAQTDDYFPILYGSSPFSKPIQSVKVDFHYIGAATAKAPPELYEEMKAATFEVARDLLKPEYDVALYEGMVPPEKRAQEDDLRMMVLDVRVYVKDGKEMIPPVPYLLAIIDPYFGRVGAGASYPYYNYEQPDVMTLVQDKNGVLREYKKKIRLLFQRELRRIVCSQKRNHGKDLELCSVPQRER